MSRLFFRPDPFKDSDGNLVQLDDIEITALHTDNDEWGKEAQIWINILNNKKEESDFLLDPDKDDIKNEFQHEIEEFYKLKYKTHDDFKEIHKLLRSKKIE